MTEEKIVKKKKYLPILIGCILIAAIAVIVFIAINASGRKQENIQEKLELAAQYLTDMDYESAIATYEEVLGINPKCSDAYIGIADTYVAMAEQEIANGDKDKAQEYYKKAIDNLNIGLKYVSEEDKETLEKKKSDIDILEEENNAVDNTEQLDIEESDIPEDINISEDSLYELLQDGITDNFITKNDITFFGADFNTITADKAKELLILQGADFDYESPWGYFMGDNYEIDLHVYDNYYYGIDENVYGEHVYDIDLMLVDGVDNVKKDIGIRNIQLGDSLSEVCEKLGFNNGDDIEKKVREFCENNNIEECENLHDNSYIFSLHDESNDMEISSYCFDPQIFQCTDNTYVMCSYELIFNCDNFSIVFQFNEWEEGSHKLDEVHFERNFEY